MIQWCRGRRFNRFILAAMKIFLFLRKTKIKFILVWSDKSLFVHLFGSFVCLFVLRLGAMGRLLCHVWYWHTHARARAHAHAKSTL